ncbi:hypothetical protein CEXT_558361 [Caerostris extrusa]|uniref:Uncharacterized protein n=1 Tax=Caerostris extrusa TaxID=172846 RepID=A0AAV4XZI1_CAEEX|nr:hypothetical protein CEXT_558361 [Caerostris extrusa]
MVPETIENEYEVMYGNAINQLIVASDVMKFVRRFNQLKYVPVIYGINTKPVCLPASDRVKNVDLAHINSIWYEEIETGPYSNISFLKNCVILCHLAACAEKNGIHRAVFFVPLILCHIMFFLRRADNFPDDIRIH